MTHTEWQAQVVQLAGVYRWHHLHVRRSVGRGKKWVTATNVKGWPDLFLWHETQHRQICAELKVPPDTPTPEQLAVLESLARSGVETHVWRPEDLDDVHATLRSPPRQVTTVPATVVIHGASPTHAEGFVAGVRRGYAEGLQDGRRGR